MEYQPRQGAVAQANAYKTWTPCPPLNQWVQCFWQLRIPAGSFSYHSIPDSCVDWILTAHDPGENSLILPFLGPRQFSINGPVEYFGLRFQILGHRCLFPHPVGALEDEVNAGDLLPASGLQGIYDAICLNDGFRDRCRMLSRMLLAQVKQPDVDRRLCGYVRNCYRQFTPAPARVARPTEDLCAFLGLSPRHLRRLSHWHLGLGPKQFARILRFQYALTSASSPVSHYHDQAHFIREFKALSGMTPLRFSRTSVLYNTQNSP